MNIAVLGTKMVGATIASRLVELGHQVAMGSRSATSEAGQTWLSQVPTPAQGRARVGTFAEAAKGAELLFNCTGGKVSLDVLASIPSEDLSGKILVDISNPLDFDRGMPPTLSVCNDSSLGEQIQARFPELRVVKTLNTVTAQLMVNPGLLAEPTTLFLSGNDKEAKALVEKSILRDGFGWEDILDLGDITTSRGTEMYLPLWIRMWGAQSTPVFNIKVVRA